jgi:TIR domain-containing protein/pentapeptide repeat protein
MRGAKVFLSYKRQHPRSTQLLRRIEAALIEGGYDVWVDEEMHGGERWPRKLYEWALECSAAVVLASPEALESDWCRREWTILAARAEVSGTRVVPILIGLAPEKLVAFESIQALQDGDDVIERLLASLKGIAPHSVGAEDYLALHRAWNRYQFNQEPVLGGEAFSLADSYIATECGRLSWGEISSGRTVEQDPFQESAGGRHQALESVIELIEKATLREPIVVQGPAGAGKSAFTLYLSVELEKRGFRAIRVRFRDMRLAIFDRVDEMLADALRVGPEGEVAPSVPPEWLGEARLRDSRTVGQTAICRWVFILDGWDEVSLSGNAGYRAQLSTWLPRLHEFFIKRPGIPVRLVVTGRPSIEVKGSDFLGKATPVLTLRSIRPGQLRNFATTLAAKSNWGLKVEKCAPVLSRYEAGGVEMLGLPLLALLALRTLASWEGDVEDLISAPTALYRALIDQTVAHSGKARDDGLNKTTHRGGPGLRRLLTRTAAMVSVFWSERITFEELKARLEEERSLSEWVDSETRDNPLHQLVVNFYFKGGHPDLGCEFLHKSFREYLFAEAIVDELIVIGEDPEAANEDKERPFWKDFAEGTIHHRASRSLSRLLSPQWLTAEVRDHVFWLIDRDLERSRDRWLRLRSVLTTVYEWWAEGDHLRLQPVHRRGQRLMEGEPFVLEMLRWAMPYTDPEAQPTRTATLDGHLGHALVQICAWVHHRLVDDDIAVDQASIDRDSLWQFKAAGARGTCRVGPWQRNEAFMPGMMGFFPPIMARWMVETNSKRTPLVLPSVLFVKEDLGGLDLENADLRDSVMLDCNLSTANLRGARIHGMRLADCTVGTEGSALREAVGLVAGNIRPRMR